VSSRKGYLTGCVEKRISLAFVPPSLAERMLYLCWPTKTVLRVLLTGADVLHHYPSRATHYQASDILIYPLTDALMTALAYQKAILATNLPGFQEVLRDEETALLVDYGDVDTYASTLSWLIRHPEERERLALGVAASGDFNSWTRIARKTQQCCASVLQLARQKVLSS
jgi:glycosyltransferase involved in cell wall biosynthesis